MADLSGPVGATIASAIVAFAGTWWFAYVLKGLKQFNDGQRALVYGAVWLAYFILTQVLIDRLGV